MNKTIKIFLASSEELENDRNAFGNLVRRLDNIYEMRGIRIILCPWEDLDAAYNDRRKQDEYNDIVRDSDLFLAVFHTRAGKFTIEEFDVATEEFKRKASPKTYVYCKDLQAGEIESPELKEFKRHLYEEMGHYWCRYGNRDTMQLHFVMQLQLLENRRMGAIIIEENGDVTFDGLAVANMTQLPFAFENENYQRIYDQLQFFTERIETARRQADKDPDDQDLQDELQKNLNCYNRLKKEFAQLQQKLFSTAKTIAEMQQRRVNAMHRRAIEAFEAGQLERANALLDEIAHEANRHMERLDQDRALVHQDIEAFLLQAKTLMADVSIPIEDRVTRVADIYAKADNWARRSAYDKEKYAQLLFDYADFQRYHAFYNESYNVGLRLKRLAEDVHGTRNALTAQSYNDLGLSCARLGNYQEALKWHMEALNIRLNIYGEEHADTAESYNNIGYNYRHLKENHAALEYYKKALKIRERVLGYNHIMTAKSYNNIGFMFRLNGDNERALYYYQRALAIKKSVCREEDDEIAVTYVNIAYVYRCMNNHEEALHYYEKAYEIRKQLLGLKHPKTQKIVKRINNLRNS